MDFTELLARNRSYRRFDACRPIDRRTLVELVELTRLCPSAANRQPLKFAVIAGEQNCGRLFPYLNWAAALTDWPGPVEEERPTGYIVVLHDTLVCKDPGVDPGITAQSILLGAVERGFGGCMLGSIERVGLREEFAIPDSYEISLVIALGAPIEEVRIENLDSAGGSVDYWRDEDGVHYVPKRTLDELMIELG